jgi:hypothetical protein
MRAHFVLAPTLCGRGHTRIKDKGERIKDGIPKRVIPKLETCSPKLVILKPVDLLFFDRLKDLSPLAGLAFRITDIP